MFLDETTDSSEFSIFVRHKLGAKWYLHGLNVTIPLQSNTTDIHSIYVDISKKITATKTYQFKKSQVFQEEALNEARG